MTTWVELKIQYFSTDSMNGVEYMVEQPFETYEDAVFGASEMIHEAEDDAMADGAQMDTFYFSYDYIMEAA